MAVELSEKPREGSPHVSYTSLKMLPRCCWMELFGFRRGLGHNSFLICLLMFGSKHDLDHQDGGANYDCAVRDIEIRPHVLPDIKLDEVDDVTGQNAVPKVPEGSAQDQRQRNSCAVQTLGMAPK